MGYVINAAMKIGGVLNREDVGRIVNAVVNYLPYVDDTQLDAAAVEAALNTASITSSVFKFWVKETNDGLMDGVINLCEELGLTYITWWPAGQGVTAGVQYWSTTEFMVFRTLPSPGDSFGKDNPAIPLLSGSEIRQYLFNNGRVVRSQMSDRLNQLYLKLCGDGLALTIIE